MVLPFDIEAGRPINNAYDQITVTFKCMGALYYDDILIDEFNRTVAEHNDAMPDTLSLLCIKNSNKLNTQYLMSYAIQELIRITMI